MVLNHISFKGEPMDQDWLIPKSATINRYSPKLLEKNCKLKIVFEEEKYPDTTLTPEIVFPRLILPDYTYEKLENRKIEIYPEDWYAGKIYLFGEDSDYSFFDSEGYAELERISFGPRGPDGIETLYSIYIDFDSAVNPGAFLHAKFQVVTMISDTRITVQPARIRERYQW